MGKVCLHTQSASSHTGLKSLLLPCYLSSSNLVTRKFLLSAFHMGNSTQWWSPLGRLRSQNPLKPYFRLCDSQAPCATSVVNFWLSYWSQTQFHIWQAHRPLKIYISSLSTIPACCFYTPSRNTHTFCQALCYLLVKMVNI